MEMESPLQNTGVNFGMQIQAFLTATVNIKSMMKLQESLSQLIKRVAFPNPNKKAL